MVISNILLVFDLFFNIYLLSKIIAKKTMLLSLLSKEIEIYKNNYETIELLLSNFDSYLYIASLCIEAIF